MPGGKQLEWIHYFHGDRARLNEKPLFLTSHMVFLGAAHALLHLFKDTDRLMLGTARPKRGDGAQASEEPTNPLKRFADEVPALIIGALTQSVVFLISSMAVYPLFVRS